MKDYSLLYIGRGRFIREPEGKAITGITQFFDNLDKLNLMID